ncbi:MAG: tetratricopeptide repeat protein [Planctomycetota bacterium]
MSTRTLTRVLTIGLLTLGAAALPGQALAQGRRKTGKTEKTEKGGKSGKSGKTDHPHATLILERGREIAEVEIREFKFDKLKYRTKGSRRDDDIKGEKVVEVRLLDPPPLFASGVSRVRAGLYKRAVESFDKTLDQVEGDDDWVWFYATYWRGQAKLLAGDAAGAATDFQAVVDKDKEHFLVPDALYGLGQAFTASKDSGKAQAAFEKLAEGFGSLWGCKAKLGLGDTLLESDPEKARAAYNLAGARAGSDKDLRRAAEVGEGKCMIARKQWDQAADKFERIITEPGLAPEVAAMAWVGKGDCRYEQAKARNDDKDLFKQALIAYQTCVVRFAGVPESYPKALFRSAELYEKLGQAKLAEFQKKELKSRCPNSPWTEKIK